MIRHFVIIIFALGFNSPLVGQIYDQNYFSNPVGHPVRLSGSFGELRTNHFHLGIDIKSTNGRSGDPILAAADGFVSRISVDASGFGNAVYIDHDNGYTTVYAHLSSLSDTINNFLKDKQYQSQKFPQQLYPDSLIFVRKGEPIGRMGNSGRSFGPHLHFEIRETLTEIPVNPFLFGIKPGDKRPPTFQSIRFYASDSTRVIQNILEKKIKNKGNGKFSLDTSVVTLDSERVSLSVLIYDQMDGAYNKNGVYQMKVIIDNKVMHGFTMDKVSYEEGHFINALIDFGEKQKSKRQFSNCFTHPVDQLSIYQHSKDRNGIIRLSPTKPTDVKIVLQDYHGNISELEFQIKVGKIVEMNKQTTDNYEILNNKKNIIRLKNADIVFNENTFLNDMSIYVSESMELTDGQELPVLILDDDQNPLFKSAQVYFKDLNIPDSLRNHFLVSKCDENNKTAFKGIWKDSLYFIELEELGSYHCTYDFTPPLIQAINLQKDMSNQSGIQIKISDNYEPGNKSLRLKYEGKINGKWVLFKYDLKNDLIYYEFDEMCPVGEHLLQLRVKDSSNNESTLTYQFSRL